MRQQANTVSGSRCCITRNLCENLKYFLKKCNSCFCGKKQTNNPQQTLLFMTPHAQQSQNNYKATGTADSGKYCAL
jgi:hypothetical protein